MFILIYKDLLPHIHACRHNTYPGVKSDHTYTVKTK